MTAAPASQLVYTQTPLAGTIVPAPCQTVIVTVSNACGKFSQCQVVVCGRDQTPPKLVCPASITVTNCLVPDALLYVSATDNCTPSNQLAFAQSPAANGNLCAGVNSVTVTVKDLAGKSSTHIIPLHIVGQISFLTNLFNTGVDDNHSLLSNGELDSHYALPTAPAGTTYTHGSGTAVAATWPWQLEFHRLRVDCPPQTAPPMITILMTSPRAFTSTNWPSPFQPRSVPIRLRSLAAGQPIMGRACI